MVEIFCVYFLFSVFFLNSVFKYRKKFFKRYINLFLCDFFLKISVYIKKCVLLLFIEHNLFFIVTINQSNHPSLNQINTVLIISIIIIKKCTFFLNIEFFLLILNVYNKYVVLHFSSVSKVKYYFFIFFTLFSV